MSVFVILPLMLCARSRIFSLKLGFQAPEILVNPLAGAFCRISLGAYALRASSCGLLISLVGASKKAHSHSIRCATRFFCSRACDHIVLLKWSTECTKYEDGQPDCAATQSRYQSSTVLISIVLLSFSHPSSQHSNRAVKWVGSGEEGSRRHALRTLVGKCPLSALFASLSSRPLSPRFASLRVVTARLVRCWSCCCSPTSHASNSGQFCSELLLVGDPFPLFAPCLGLVLSALLVLRWSCCCLPHPKLSVVVRIA